MNSTQIRYHRRRLADVAQAMRLARTQVSREQQHRAQLAEHQQRRLQIVLRHAAVHSPFYRRWFTESAAGKRPVDLANLPILTRPVLMEHFDELVCDPRLRRGELLDWVGQMSRDQLYLDRYRVLLTSGSSGRPGLFVYDAGGWRSIAAGFVRTADWCQLRPTVPRQRMAWIGGVRPSHITCQGAATMAIGLHQILSLPVTLPLRQLVEALNQFQPTYLNVYPSIAMWLADEQQARPPAHLATDDGHRRGAADPRDDRTPGQRVRGAALRPLRLHRGALRLRVRVPPRHPPLRGHHTRRERRRRQPTRAGRTAGCPTAAHQPAQPRPAADPGRGDRHGHRRPRPVPMRAHPDPR